MKPIWKDTTSYSRDDSDHIPRTWTMGAGEFRIIVTRLHGVDGVWFTSVPGLYSHRQLAPLDLGMAQAEAIRVFKDRLQSALDELGKD